MSALAVTATADLPAWLAMAFAAEARDTGAAAGGARADGDLALDADDFGRFYEAHGQALWRYARRVTGDPATADDVVQDSFVRLLGHPAVASSDADRRRAYLFRIASNLMRDRWRAERRREGWLDRLLAPGRTPAHGTAVESRLDLEAALARARPRDRALLWLAHVEGYEHREIAAILGLAAPSVRVLLHRARRRVEALLAAEDAP